MASKISFNVKLLIGFILAIVIIAVINIVAYNAVSSVGKANNWVSHTYEVIEKTASISSMLTDAEDNEHQYLLSGDEQRLSKYQQSVNALGPAINNLGSLVSDNAEQVQNVDSLKKYMLLKLGLMDKLVTAQNAGQLQRESLNTAEMAGNASMDKCREITDTIIFNERALLVSRTDVSKKTISITMWTMLLSTIIVISILGFLFFFITKTFITNQRLKDKLQISESIFGGVFRDSGVGMALVSLKGRWMEVNPYLLELLGYTSDELRQKTFQDITHPEDIEADMSLVEKTLAGEIDTYKLEKRYFHKKGHVIWGLLTVSLVRKENGAARFFISQIEDISATKLLIQELELNNKLLSHTSTELEAKIIQLEDFNRIVAHNLRGPANGIEVMIQMTIDETDAHERAQMLGLMHESSKSLNSTLSDLMQILEIRLNQGIEYENCDLNEITATTTKMLQGEILRTQAVVHTDFAIDTIRFPKVYMASVFYNMVSNSLKYKRDDVPLVINISSQLENNRIKLIFDDNGLGIDLDQYGEHIFKLNKVFHKGYDSKGVGLFITKNQLETYGGSISVESVPNEGARFIIYIKA